ncbi:hypothetical protein U0070_013167, partial [Myodes glareolus]
MPCLQDADSLESGLAWSLHQVHRHSAHPDRIREQKPRDGQVEMGLARPMLGGKEFTAPWGRKLWGTPVCHLPVDLMKTPGKARFQGVSILETAEEEDPQPEEQQGLQQQDWQQQGLQQLDWQQPPQEPQPPQELQPPLQPPQEPQPPLQPPQEPQPPLQPPQLEQEQAGTQQHTGLQQQEPQPPQLEPQPPEQPQQPMVL